MEENKLCPFRQEIYKGNKAKSLDLIQETRFGICLGSKCAIYNAHFSCCGLLKDANGIRR